MEKLGYFNLHKHKGTQNYEVIPLSSNMAILEEKVLIDEQKKLVYINSENEKDFCRKKIDFFGSEIEKSQINCELLKDRTLWHSSLYSNWLINNDSNFYNYIDPFTNQEITDIYEHKQTEKDYKKWFIKFKELYEQASYVKEHYMGYYLKIEDKWFYMQSEHNDKNKPNDFEKLYPSKETVEQTIFELKNITKNLKKNKIIKFADYKQLQHKGGNFFNPSSFSAGIYAIDLHLPQGDILKFNHFNAYSFTNEMNIYKISKELGGSDEIFFIELIPRQTAPPNTSFGGLYVVRPRNYKELDEYKLYINRK